MMKRDICVTLDQNYNLIGERRRRLNNARCFGSRRGVAVVELALVMPFLLVLCLGICELGQALKAESILSAAVRKACASGSRPGCSNADVISDAQAVLTVNRLPGSSATVTILVNDLSSDVAAARRNDKITVTVSIPTSLVVTTNLLTFLIAKPTLAQTITMLKQG